LDQETAEEAMIPWVFGLCFGCIATSTALAQCDASPVMIQQLCADALPADRRIQLQGPNGPCWCDCPELQVPNMAFPQLAARRASAWESGLRQFLMADGKPIAPKSTRRLVSNHTIDLTGEGRIYFDSATAGMCRAVSQLQEIATSIGHMAPMFDSIHFYLTNDLDSTGTPADILPRADGHYHPGLAKRVALIHIPETMLRDYSVGRELMEFMLLHELHHVIHSATSTEHDADLWAASAGWYLLHDRRWPTENELLSIADQLHAYYESQIVPAQFKDATESSDYGLNCYPVLSCRTERIRNTCLALSDLASEGIRWGYPLECWEPAAEEPFEANDPPERDTGSECTDLSRSYPYGVLFIKGMDEYTTAMHRHASLMERICAREPQMCLRLRPTRIGLQDTRLFGRELLRRKFERKIRRATKAVNKVNDRMLDLTKDGNARPSKVEPLR